MVKLQKNISVILPAYNEEQNIGLCLKNTCSVLNKIVKDFEIIVINDGSSDSTKNICEDFTGKIDKIKLINKEFNEGYGKAIRDGFENAKFELVFFMDTDRQFDILYLKDLLFHIDKYHVVIGFRNNRKDVVVRKLSSFFYNLIIRLFFSLKVKDVNCAFKLFRKDMINKIDIISEHYFINAEILFKAQLLGYKIKEVEVPHFKRVQGVSKVKWSDIFITLKEIAAVRKNL